MALSSPTEAKQLAERLEHEELVCRTAAQADDPVVVADVEVAPADAWQLAGQLEIRNVASPALY